MLQGRRLEVVAQGKLSERQMRDLLGGSSKTPKELLQSFLLATAEAAAAGEAQVAAEAAREASAAEAVAAVCRASKLESQSSQRSRKSKSHK